MAYEKDVVVVNITLGTKAVTQVGFGTLLIAGTSGKFAAGTIRFYANIDEVGDDFASSDPEYKAAELYFSQSPAPERLAITQRAAATSKVTTIKIDTATEGHEYTATVNGVEYSYTAVALDTATTIATALAALIAADTTITATNGVSPTDTITITGNVVGVSFTAVIDDALMTLTNVTAAHGIQDDLNTIVELTSGNDWYCLQLPAGTATDKLQAAAWVQTHYKIHAVDVTGANALAGTDTTVNALFALGYTRTFCFYSGTASANQGAGWAGVLLPTTPGSSTWANKTIVGLAADALTSSQIAALRAKNVSFYETVGGVNITRDGKMLSGEWIDVIVGTDWIQARMEEAVYSVLINNSKVPYTDDGITMIANAVRSILSKARDENGILSAFTVTQIPASQITPQEKATRKLTAVSFTGTLAGAIHQVTITGTVTY